jgi:transposase
MMRVPSSNTRVYLATGSTDMRKAIGGLSMLVEGALELDPFSGHLFGFCNRRRNIVKILYWDRNGFCLWQKRLERDRFRWPGSAAAVLELEPRELEWLLEGLDVKAIRPHRELHYSTVL